MRCNPNPVKKMEVLDFKRASIPIARIFWSSKDKLESDASRVLWPIKDRFYGTSKKKVMDPSRQIMLDGVIEDRDAIIRWAVQKDKSPPAGG